METRKSRHQKTSRIAQYRARIIKKIRNTAAVISLPVLVVGATAILLPVAWLALPTPNLPADTAIYDQNGRLVSVLYGTENRMPIPYSRIPAVMQNALVAIEDNTYWVEPAIDPVGILRAAIVDISSRQILQGGSTITQQLAKNLYLSDVRTFSRKFKELFFTIKLSTMFDKRQIINMYLNDVYFGQGAYGIQAASQVYFGHGAATLSLPEAALLAGLVNAPSYYDPYAHPGAAITRRNLVLHQMMVLHYITPAQEAAAINTPLSLGGGPYIGDRAPYFTKFLSDQLAQLDPSVAKHLYDGGYSITTTMNWTMQQAAQRAVADYMPPISKVNGVYEPEVGLTAIDPKNGYVEAIVGGDNYANSPFDRATQALRQPGSAMKYFLYTTVINDGYSTSAAQDSAPVRFPAGNGKWYVPHNYGNVFNGPLPIRYAIALSDNICAVKWMNIVGPPAMISMAHVMGITSPLADNLTTALGSSSVTTYEMARGVSTIANGGYRVHPICVLKVVNAQGQTVFSQSAHLTRVITPQVAYVVGNLFHAPLLNSRGTAHDLHAIFSRPAAAKTGTSSQQRDAWLVGFTPQLAAAVWVGNDNYSPLGLTGDLGAGPIWAHFMKWALVNQPVETFTKPPGIVSRTVCTKTGLLSNGCCNTYTEVYIRGHEPTKFSPGCGYLGKKGNANPAAQSPGKNLLQQILKSLTP